MNEENAIVESNLNKLGENWAKNTEWVKYPVIIYKYIDVPNDVGLINDRYSKNALEFLGIMDLAAGKLKKSDRQDKSIELEDIGAYDIGAYSKNGSRLHPRAIFMGDGRVFIEKSLLTDRRYLEYICSKTFLGILNYWEHIRKNRRDSASK